MVTSRNEKIFDTVSCRDISGKFVLDAFNGNSESNLKKEDKEIKSTKPKTYLKLKLRLIIKFFNDQSLEEFNRQRKEFETENRKLDIESNLYTNQSIDGYEPYILVRLAEKENPLINYSIYFLFSVVIPIVELYKIYVESDSLHQGFTIVKLISTKTELKSKEFDKLFMKDAPVLEIGGKQHRFWKNADRYRANDDIRSSQVTENKQTFYRQDEKHLNVFKDDNLLKEPLLDKNK